MALNLNLVDTLADEFGDSEGEEELEEEPMPGLLKVVSEMTKENTKILGAMVPQEPSPIDLVDLTRKYPQV